MRSALVAFSSLALVGAAAAQTPQGQDNALDRVYACAAITQEAERLACYDNAVGRLRQAQTSGDLVAVDRTRVEEIERDAFGFSLPSIPRLFGGRERDSSEPNVAEVAMEVARVSRRPDGSGVFTMTNGQVWTQIDGGNNRRVREGGAVTVRRAALGSFLMSVEAGGPAIRVRRSQ
jgi:hypothetical protein